MDDRQTLRDSMLPSWAQRAQDGTDDRAFQAAPAGERTVELTLMHASKRKPVPRDAISEAECSRSIRGWYLGRANKSKQITVNSPLTTVVRRARAFASGASTIIVPTVVATPRAASRARRILRLGEKHTVDLNPQARAVNFGWNYCNNGLRHAFNKKRRALERQ